MTDHPEKEGPHNIPAARVKAIAGLTQCIPLTPEAIYAVGKASELFIEEFVKNMRDRYGEKIDYDEIAAYVQECDEVSFLNGFFPRRMTFREAEKKGSGHKSTI